MIKVIKSGISAEAAADMDAKVKATVETTLSDIETRGDEAVRKLSEKFDNLSLIHISEPTRRNQSSRMPSSA